MSFGGSQWPQDPRQPYRSYGEPVSSSTPDWAALADASAARARRRRWLLIGAGGVATAAVAAIVATAVVFTGDAASSGKNAGELPTAPELPGRTAQPEPSFSTVAPPPPPNPRDFVSSAKKDTAPLSADTLFPGGKLTMGDRVYTKGPTARTADCPSATRGSLAAALRAHGCDQVIRATYTKDGVAVTVGVAVFPTEAQAQAAVNRSARGIAPLSGSGVAAFCKGGPVCRFVGNSYGRYAYFTATGYISGKSVTAGDTKAFQPGDDLAEFTFRQIVRRGEMQASAAAAAPAG
ncbi:hypothetical protein OTC26_018205 [Streptomyces tirandamycinicus]|uniref:hypothetical protein n=1 Tax=Streptomyces tirandamycinicus TaxID=2174846 RepID=UPI00226DDD2D|nr:hypothetical protein [Streptomyces tirandamycinicus]MCY0981677.1 hypothetical protein [Streptomyces tirandamycinicus]